MSKKSLKRSGIQTRVKIAEGNMVACLQRAINDFGTPNRYPDTHEVSVDGNGDSESHLKVLEGPVTRSQIESRIGVHETPSKFPVPGQSSRVDMVSEARVIRRDNGISVTPVSRLVRVSA